MPLYYQYICFLLLEYNTPPILHRSPSWRSNHRPFLPAFHLSPSTSMLSVTLYVHSCLSPSFAFCFALFLLSAPLPPHLLITFSSLTRPSFQLKPTQTSGLRLTCPRSHDPHAGVGGTEGRKEIRRKRAEWEAGELKGGGSETEPLWGTQSYCEEN